ncbi:MAG: hypothetical protein ACYC1Z_13470 [Georgenia sp.]
MMETTAHAAALPNGATYSQEFTVAATGVDFTGCVVRLDVRKTANGDALVSLSSAGDPTTHGSALTVSAAGDGTLTFRVRFTDEETDLLPLDATLYSDVEIEYPSGDVDRPVRITWTTDGSFTHV